MRRLIMCLMCFAFGCDDGDGGDGTPPDRTDAMADGATADDGTPDMRPTPDGGRPDAMALDAGPADAGPVDAGPVEPGDANQMDGGPDPDLGVPEGECRVDGECLGFARCVDNICVPPGESPLSAVIVLNEVLIDGAIDVDANDDGDISALDDEFVELLNIGPEPVDLTGATLVESDILGVPRHTFPAGFMLAPGEAVVLFGGGSPSEALEAVAGARFVVVNAQDPAFSNGLNLDDGGDILRLLDAAGDEVFVFAYGDACAANCPPMVADQSITRSPDGMGGFVAHGEAGGIPISPGRRVDGTLFLE